MRHFYFTLTLCILFFIQSSKGQKLEKVYTSPVSSKSGISPDTPVQSGPGAGAIMPQKNGNIKTTDNGYVIEFAGENQDSLIVDYIHYDGRSVHHKKIIKSDIDPVLGEQNRYISDSSRFIIINSKEGLFNIKVYDINTGSLIQSATTTISPGDVFKKFKDKIRSTTKGLYYKNSNLIISGGHLYGNMLLIKIDIGYESASVFFWIDLISPEEIFPVFPEFPKINDSENRITYQIWTFLGYQEGVFIYNRYYLTGNGPKQGTACTIALFDKNGALIRSFDPGLELNEYNSYHPMKLYHETAQVIFDRVQKVFYLVSSVKSDQIVKESKYALILKKIDLSGKVLWEQIYFDKEFFTYGEEDCDEINFNHPIISSNNVDQTVSVAIGLCNKIFNFGSVSFNSINGHFMSKTQIPSLSGFSIHSLDPLLEKQMKNVMESNKYKENIPVFFEKSKTQMVLFKDANGGYAVYKYK